MKSENLTFSLAFLPARSFLWESCFHEKGLGTRLHPERRPVQERKPSGTSFWQQKFAAELRDQKGIWKAIGRHISGVADAKFHPMNGANHFSGCLVSVSRLWSQEGCGKNQCLLRFCITPSHLILTPLCVVKLNFWLHPLVPWPSPCLLLLCFCTCS